MHPIRILLLLLLPLVGCGQPDRPSLPEQEQVSPHAASGGVNAPDQRSKPTLILVSIDGFRWDYPDLFDTPAIDRLVQSGVRAEALVPAFPTLTFPNHYTIATGLYPGDHGIVANNFPSRDRTRWYQYKRRETVQDGRWYGGEPIWVAAERAGMVSAAFFFVGTEAAVGGVQPSYWRAFDAQVPGIDRVDQVLRWLALPAASRPHMITLYFEDVDVASHAYGPESRENLRAVRHVDAYLDRLMQGIAALPVSDNVYVVLVSDHGQSTYKQNARPFVLGDHVDLKGIATVDGGSLSFLFFNKPDRRRAASIRDVVNNKWQHGKVWLRNEAPSEWHVADDSRFPDLIVLADPQQAVLSERKASYKLLAGNHGWDPSFEDMHGIFIATGPRLPQGERIGRINSVDIYPLMLEILGLSNGRPLDGDPESLTRLLR